MKNEHPRPHLRGGFLLGRDPEHVYSNLRGRWAPARPHAGGVILPVTAWSDPPTNPSRAHVGGFSLRSRPYT